MDLETDLKWRAGGIANRETEVRQLAAEESKWKQMTGAIARVMWPAEE